MPASATHQVIIAFGSNLGDRSGYIISALAALQNLPRSSVLSVSSLYETKPVGFTNQPDFLNAVGAIATSLSPEELLDHLLRIESEHGRVRTVPNGPRTLDLDLLFFGQRTYNTSRLTLPHPRYAERPFVYLPLAELLIMEPLDRVFAWDALRIDLTCILGRTRDPDACRHWGPPPSFPPAPAQP